MKGDPVQLEEETVRQIIGIAEKLADKYTPVGDRVVNPAEGERKAGQLGAGFRRRVPGPGKVSK